MTHFIEQANRYGSERRPFFFMIDFEKVKPLILPLEECRDCGIYYSIEGDTNVELDQHDLPEIRFKGQPIDFIQYEKAFDHVKSHIQFGDSYLTNLCFPTPLDTNLSLRDMFRHTRARFKLLVDNDYMVFSPEPFVKIDRNQISTYPMKGTIDAHIDNAESKILNDGKEMEEHATIVDLLRNDLNRVAKNVRVERYRYIDRVTSHEGALLQVSSKIVGDLDDDAFSRIGDLLDQLTPAGSVSGAPKKKTTEIIREAEGQDRGYFTGIFGLFDGSSLKSGVMIRFVEKKESGMRFWSGGGITNRSNGKAEYNEMIQKVYVPIY